jgi:hypothetical protein
VEIDALARSYAVAGDAAEAAADRLERIEENAVRGADAMSDLFLGVLDGSTSAREAVAQLVLEIGRIQLRRAFGVAAASNGGNNILGLLGGLLSFDGGGWTGNGARAGGLDGRGGFLAIMHPRETVIDRSRAPSGPSGPPRQEVRQEGDVHVHFHGIRDAEGFRQSRAQISADLARAVSGARRST